MRFRLTSLSASLLVLHTIPALADTPTLDTVVVTAAALPEIPASPYRLAPANIAPQLPATSDTASLLQTVPGVSLHAAGGVSSLPVMHGLADDRLHIQVDGMGLVAACPNHMNAPLSNIDPTAVATVHIYPGVSPVSVGGDSIGGSIVVDSTAPVFAGAGQGTLLQGEAGAFYRSNGNAAGGNLAATVATEHASLSYTGAYAQADNYVAGGDFKAYTATGRAGHTLSLDEVGSSAYETRNQNLRFAWRNDAGLFEMRYGRQDIPEENFPNQRMDMTRNSSDQFSLGYAGMAGGATVKAKAWYEHTQHEMNFGDDKQLVYGTATDGMPMNTDGKNRGLTLAAEIPLNGHGLLRTGLEYQGYTLDDWWPASGTGMMAPNTFQNINDGQRDRYALFTEWETALSAQWDSRLGLRHETVKLDAGEVQGYAATDMMGSNQLRDSTAFNSADRSRSDQNWDASWIARFTPAATASYSIGLAQKTRSPSLYELYAWSTWSMAAIMNNFVGDGNGYVGNLALEPEVAHTLTLTGDWHDADQKQWSLQLTPYYSRVQDYIDARCLPGTTCTAEKFNVLQYDNVSAELYGADLAGRVQLGSGRAGDFSVQGMASYTRGRNLDSKDDLYNIMPLNGRLALIQQAGAWQNTLEGQFVAGKDAVSAVRNEMTTPGYTLVNLRARFVQPRYSVELGVENLLDRLYYAPLSGAYLGQGMTMAMNPSGSNPPQWGTPVPGPGRNIYVGLNAKF